MSNQEHSKQQNRPSLYESRGTTSAFSILSVAQPSSWSKRKSIGISIMSFIAGGILTGGAVGLMSFTDQQHPLSVELTTTTHADVALKNSEKPIPNRALIVPPTPDPKVSRTQPISNQPVAQDPLALFKEDDVLKNTRVKPIVQKNNNSSALSTKELALKDKDDAELQRLIDKRSHHVDSPVKVNADHSQLDKSKRELLSPPYVAVKFRKPLAHDKDVLLVKSMLDTMGNPLTVNVSTSEKSADEGH